MDNELQDLVLEVLVRNGSRPRQHASYFECDDKQQKEADICEILASHLETFEKYATIETIQPGDDPPDCIMRSADLAFAVEVTELVNEAAIKYQIRNQPKSEVFSQWTAESLSHDLTQIVRRKDLYQGKFDRTVLLIHTDEPELTVTAFDEIHPEITIDQPAHFGNVYLIFGYDPRFQICPVRKLL